MEGERAAGDGGVLERAPHQTGGDDRAAVVGERRRAGLGKLHHLRQLLAVLTLRDRREEPGRNECLLRGPLHERAEHRRAVDNGVRVGHGEKRAVAAGRGGGGTARDRLFVLSPRRPQVDVRVDERGCDHSPTRACRLDSDYDSVFDRHRKTFVDPLGRVDDPAFHDERIGPSVPAGERHHATSRGTAARTGPVVSRS